MTDDDAPTVAFTVSHPHDVHLFRNAIQELSDEGYSTPVFARDKEMTVDLLDRYEIPYKALAGGNDSKAELVRSWSTFGFNLFRECRRTHPDLLVAEVGAVTAPVARLLGTDCLVFVDAEHARLQNALSFPFATRICTSNAFWKDLGTKQIRYDGYQELAYLHPDRFDPDPSVLDEAGLDEDETFVILRTVGWNAVHDINAGGFDALDEVIRELEAEGATVLVTSERPLPNELASYRLSIEPHRIHDLMYYADLYLGESATMATESALLGTPAVYVSTLQVGYTTDIARRYGLIFNYSGEDRQRLGMAKAKAILDGTDETDWSVRRRRLLAETRDTTCVILEQVRDLTGRNRPERRVLR